MRTRLTVILTSCAAIIAQTVLGQANLAIYTDHMVNGFQDWSWATRNMANTSPVHSGSDSISVSSAAYTGLSFEYPGFNTAPYANFSFWANGGSTGGQHLQVYVQYGSSGTGPTYTLPSALPTNSWQQFVIPLSTLGVANMNNVNRLTIQSTGSGTIPTFYIDDIQIGAAPAPALVHLGVNATNALRTADSRWFGVNTATWDSYLGDSHTLPFMRQAGLTTLRWPGGSTSDAYHWTNDISNNNTFNQLATNLGANVFITVNYGTGSSNEAASWVKFANVTNHCGFKYWEIGNECYGAWETDSNNPAWDPYTYAVRAAGYVALMKAADSTIKIGVVATPGEDSYSNNAAHPVVNPRTGLTHYGWTPVMLTYLRSNGITPDFLIHHVYPEYTSANPTTGTDSDALVLQASANWASDAANLRQQLTDYLGSNGTNVELCCTENNSDSGSQGRQSTSIVNALYLADNMAQIMKTEINSYIWWDFRNGSDTNGSFDPTLYGWRKNGDLGMVWQASTSNYPTFYAEKLMQYFARAGDSVLNPTSDYLLLSAYAAYRTNGSLTLLVINKDVTTNLTAQISLTSFTPAGTATVRSFGILQDEATRTNNTTAGSKDISTNTLSVTTLFTNTFPAGSLTLITFTPPAPTTVTLTSGANPSTYGNSVTFTATVRTNGVAVGNITGETVTFYNGAVQLGTGTLNGSGQATYSTTATQLSAGTCSITAAYPGDANYAGSTNSPALSQTVNQATATAGLTGTVSKNYDGTTAATLAPANYTLSGVVSGDTVTLNNPTSGTYDTRNQGTGKTVTVTGLTISGASAANYTLSSTSASGTVGTINKTNITVTAAANSKTYDGTTGAAAAPAITSGSVQTGDTASFMESYDTKNAGTGKTLTPSGSVNDGNSGNNYNYTFLASANGTINALPVNLTGSRPYDGTTAAPAGILSVANKVGSDDVFVASGSGTLLDATVGPQAITSFGTLTLGGASAGNYTLSGASGSVNITARGSALTVTNLLALDKVYDGTTNATLDATNAGLDGVSNGDDVTLITSNAVAYFADKNVATNKPVTVIGLTLGGAAATNYSLIDPTNVTASITPAALTVTGVTAVSKVYDGTTVAQLSGTATLNGAVTNDDVSLVTSNMTASFADPNVGINKPVTVTGYAVTGADAGNYTLAQPAGLTADILPLVTPVFASQGIIRGAGGCQLSFSAQAGQTYKVLVTVDLRLPLSQWTVLTSGTFGSGTTNFTDNATNLPNRFYLIVSP
jgi:hypothetical protein